MEFPARPCRLTGVASKPQGRNACSVFTLFLQKSTSFLFCALPALCVLTRTNQDTGESFWEPPGVPFRPMIRDRMSGALVQAWPQLERELMEVRCRHMVPRPLWGTRTRFCAHLASWRITAIVVWAYGFAGSRLDDHLSRGGSILGKPELKSWVRLVSCPIGSCHALPLVFVRLTSVQYTM